MSRVPGAAVRTPRAPFDEGTADAPRVLIIEDERIVAADLRRVVRELGYCAYAIAPTAAQALEVAAQLPPDVVLADIRIEGPVDGIDAAFQLRQQYGAAIVFLTAHADDPTVERAKRAEPSGYLLKPVSPLAVKAALEIALDRREREATAQALEHSLIEVSAQLLSTLNHLPIAVQLEDDQNRVVHTNPAFRALFDLAELGADLVGLDGRLVMQHVTSQCREAPLFKATVDTLRRARAPMSGNVISLLDGRKLEMDFIPIVQKSGPQGQLWIFRDISIAERTREELEHKAARRGPEAFVDSLTRLVSRRGFFELAPAYLMLGRNASGRQQVLVFAHLDGVKPINEHSGHTTGDEAICTLANALRGTFRASDLIARLGADEFVVLATMTPLELAGAASRLSTRLSELSRIVAGGSSQLAVSVGIVECRPGESLDALLSRAGVSTHRHRQTQRSHEPPRGD